MLILHEKNVENSNFWYFLRQKLPLIGNFQHIKNSEIQIVSLYGKMLWCKFQQIWTKITTPDTFCVKYFKFQIFRIFL